MMGVWIKEPTFADPERIRPLIERLGREGYDAIRIFPRQTVLFHTDPRVIEAVGAVVEMAHKVGLKAGFDCEPHTHQVGHDMGIRSPRDMGYRVVPVRGSLVDGRYTLRVPFPNGCQVVARIDAFVVLNGKATKVDFSDAQRAQEFEYLDSGFTERTDGHDPHRPAQPKMFETYAGRLAGHRGGELLALFSFEDNMLVDFWSDACESYYTQLVQAYAKIPLDGIGWDEPFAQVDWSHYRFGPATAAAFKRLKGYDLVDEWWRLECGGCAPENTRTRMDYYHVLNEGSFKAQSHFNELAKATWGQDIFLGTHHTWCGEGHINDYRAGAVDYFRLGECMDAGYTDTPWYFERSMYYAYTLGSSLGRLSPTKCTEMNVWSWKPTNTHVDHCTRILSLMNLNWFNIWCGDAADTTLYPQHYTYAECVKDMLRNRKAREILDTATPVVDIAIWHGWEGVASHNRTDYAFAQKDFYLHSGSELFTRSIPHDYIDSRLLADGSVKEGRLHTRLGSYAVVILPFALALPEKAWLNLVAMAEAGGHILFTGIAPQQTTEGKSLVEEFARRAGVTPQRYEEIHARLQSVYRIPSTDSFRLEVRTEVDVTDGAPWINSEGNPCGGSGMGGHFHYWSEFAPTWELAEFLARVSPPAPVHCLGEGLIWRLYKTDGGHKLAVAATKNRTRLKALVSFQGKTMDLDTGSLAIIDLPDKGEWKVIPL